MSNARGEDTVARRSSYWRDIGFAWLNLAVWTAAVLALQFLVLQHLLWYQNFAVSHPFWAQLTPVWVVCLLLGFFGRRARVAETAAFREDFRQGRVKRMSLASRSAVMLAALALVVAGSQIRGPYSAACLVLGVPVLLLFSVEELNILLRPGESVRTDRHDELAAFFRARTLQVGYSIAILSLLTVYIFSLFASRYVSALLPIVLTISLLAPSCLYSRLDRRAASDE
ncbi:MAG TPA: hypothetical protein VGM97_21570 [Steroidobacteraceae bacterium]|jgi:hypothetical protein